MKLTESSFHQAPYVEVDDLVGVLDPSDNATSASDEIAGIGHTCPICQAACSTHTRDNLTACDECGHAFQTDMTITVSYDADYAHQYDSRPVREMSELRWQFIQTHLNLPKGSRILDVGYGNGAFLKRAREAGMQIYGIDVHSEDFGVPNVTFDTDLHFDLVCFFDSLEHFPDFELVRKLSAENVIVSIPNTPSVLLTNPTSWRHYKPGEHLHYFSRESLDRFMRAWGFPKKLADGFPEDNLRGKLTLGGQPTDNIYTAIYMRGKAPLA